METGTDAAVRSSRAEQEYNKRWLIGVTAGPLAAGLLAGAWMFSVAGNLPDPLASHWGPDGVDGYMSLPGNAAIAVFVCGGSGALVAGLAIAARATSRAVARIGVGFGLAMGIAMTGLAVAVVAGQIGLDDASQASASAPVIWTSVLVAALTGAVLGWLYRPGEVERLQSPETREQSNAASGPLLSATARAAAAAQQSLAVNVSMGPVKWLLSMGIGAVVTLSLVFILPPLGLLGIPAAALMLAFCQGKIVIDPDGVRVLAGGFWKLMPLSYEEIRGESVEDIIAMDFGGWGYRLTGGSVGFIMRSGPALVLTAGFKQRFVFSMPDAETAARACALVSAYRTGSGDDFHPPAV
ncbi:MULTISPECIES: hypothetical protein [Arthrobacter]|uniref:hypothetical protein n=1 Tax=Arthrobacter TaxID=1663 RepID=UPI0006D9B8A0|nr:hypothetical protein [Arthrobacter sp. Edens01]KPN21770.1 hypothetical protein AO716_01770 [Arthrobacter sp. Edens01]